MKSEKSVSLDDHVPLNTTNVEKKKIANSISQNLPKTKAISFSPVSNGSYNARLPEAQPFLVPPPF